MASKVFKIVLAVLAIAMHPGCSSEQTAAPEETQPTDPIQALQDGVNNDDPAAMYRMAVRYDRGDGVKGSYERADELLKRAADLNYPPALRRLARNEGFSFRWLHMGSIPISAEDAAKADAHFREAVRLYERAANFGSLGAAEDLGLLLLTARKIPNAAAAVPWLTLAARGSRPASMLALYRIYSVSRFGAVSEQQASYWKSQLEALEDADALGEVARLICNGFLDIKEKLGPLGAMGTRFSLERPLREWAVEAEPYLLKAAEKNHAGSQQLLGKILLYGYAGYEAPERAAKWLTLAADGGHVQSQIALGRMYLDGNGVAQDYETAAQLFEKAANSPDAKGYLLEAQALMGALTERGLGVPKDLVKAHAWYNIAVTNGYEDAISLRDELTAELSGDQLAQAHRLARNWKPGDPRMSSRMGGDLAPNEPSRTASAVALGSGFVVTRSGYIVTNSHVVGDCAEVRVSGKASQAAVVALDPVNDLALLKTADLFPSAVTFRRQSEVVQGEEVLVYGYPLAGALASSGGMSAGSVTATSGLRNNSSHVQIDAPIQRGNSGGPLLDRKGHVIGVVVTKLDAMKVAALTGDIPQNVNFAIKHTVVKAFLAANSIEHGTAWPFAFEKSPEQITKAAKEFTVLLVCWR